MFGWKRDRARFCRVPWSACMLDQAVTLWYQSASYWRDYSGFADEENPHGRWLLQRHPLAFVAGVLLWAILFTAAIHWLPRRAAMTTALAVTIGHVWGSCTWILNQVRHGYWLCIVLVVVVSSLTVANWDLPAISTDTAESEPEPEAGTIDLRLKRAEEGAAQ